MTIIFYAGYIYGFVWGFVAPRPLVIEMATWYEYA
jgi:hypothetical protein